VGIVLDTSVLIEWERKAGALEVYAAAHPDEPLGLSVITAAELFHGVHRADTAARRLKRSAFVEYVLSSFPVLEFKSEAQRLWPERRPRPGSDRRGISGVDYSILSRQTQAGMR
jgi:tRNA(fMet)-specific endonuclease VapC